MAESTKTKILLEKADASGFGASVPDWLVREHRLFAQRLLDRDYPCYFGTSAEKRGELRYGYTEGDVGHLPVLLRKFLKLSRSRPKIRHALALFFAPEEVERPLSYYRRRFWETLGFLHGEALAGRQAV